MPVQVFPAKHAARSVRATFVDDPLEVLSAAWPSSRFHELLQSSFEGDGLPTHMQSSTNGLLYAIVASYNEHHHLRIRPEDVWFAVLTQLSIYINEHAEELRHLFVAHEGQKELVIQYGVSSRYAVDYGDFAEQMGNLIQKNIIDAEFRDWIMPGFTTTTQQDNIIASIMMMGTLKKYFRYTCMTMCGIPSVTLLGEKEDYLKILQKLDKLASFGEEPALFGSLLIPILRRFVQTFENPKSSNVRSFWNKIMAVEDFGSGSPQYHGWMTAFCFWNDKGKCLYRIDEKLGEKYLELDNAKYHWIDSGAIPPGWAKVPVKINDMGTEIDSEMVAGSVGINCTSSGQKDKSGAEILDTMQPQTGWWIYAKSQGEHPSLAEFRAKARAKNVSEETIELLVQRGLNNGRIPSESNLDFYAINPDYAKYDWFD